MHFDITKAKRYRDNTLTKKRQSKNLHLIDDSTLNRTQLDDLLIQLSDRWLLRMSCHSFIMVVSKHSGRYVNIYRDSLKNGADLDMIVDKLELHPNYK